MNRAIVAIILCAPMLGCASSTHPPPVMTSSATSVSTPTLAEARRGIREANRRNRAAMLAKDMKAVMALRTGDFHSITPDGKLHDRAAMEEYTGGFLNGVERWISISFKVER